jgi:alkylation response protein AidB-like acyl-CoA dehydrogenase
LIKSGHKERLLPNIVQLPTIESLKTNIDFGSFIDQYKERLHDVFRRRLNINKMSLNRGLPPFALKEVMESKPLSVFIPEEYEGRGANVAECLKMLETTAYESLPLSLMMGINGALFLQPIVRYADEDVRQRILHRFMHDNAMGGLMITEPDYGSDALHMQTQAEELEESYQVQGQKHWAGLTGWADYWLITAREKSSSGKLGRDISFFIHDSSEPGIEVEEYFNNLGLYMLPYGRNNIDINVPKDQKLQPNRSGIQMMLDILHRSRLQFPGMALGFIRRMMDEAIHHCKDRVVGGNALFTYDQVKERLARLQSYFTISSAMCAYTTSTTDINEPVTARDLSANAIKTYATDMMHEASQSLLQLVGAKGYRNDHIAGRSVVDSRPFQIFEGSNDILYQQISESVIKKMRKMSSFNLYDYMSEHHLTEHASDYVKDMLDFKLDPKMAQRKLVDLGKVISRIISLNFTIELGQKGFNSRLIENTIQYLKSDIEQWLQSYQNAPEPSVVEADSDMNWHSLMSS